MRKPTKPKVPRLAASNTPTVPTLDTLTSIEVYLVSCYRQLLEEQQRIYVNAIARGAERNVEESKPVLRLIQGGTV